MLSVSTAPLNTHRDIATPYYDLESTAIVMDKMLDDSVIDGFELQLLEDWVSVKMLSVLLEILH